MIEGHEKFRLIDQNGKNDWFMEVNWKPDDPLTNECKVVRITFPDGQEAFIKREHLHSVLFAIGRPEEQRKMIPQTLTKMRWYETVLSVVASKDIHKGENITFPVKISLPAAREQVIGGVKKNAPKETLWRP